ncbi:MAG: hypothetical protein FWG05_03335, partial [Kiritimatiellaeota bacterium]|nr:hypothetical protein [Kiritimatiellota bacterium]
MYEILELFERLKLGEITPVDYELAVRVIMSRAEWAPLCGIVLFSCMMTALWFAVKAERHTVPIKCEPFRLGWCHIAGIALLAGSALIAFQKPFYVQGNESPQENAEETEIVSPKKNKNDAIQQSAISNQQLLSGVPRTNSITPVAGYYPEHWKGDDTCTLGDGLPDEWRRRTHTIGYDADIDLDGDGLTIRQEFWYGTDPRRARTMGGPFTDGELYEMGRDPLEPVDLTPNEDPALWAGTNYGAYSTPDSDGFVPWYAQNLPAPSENNVDVWVDIKTTRSAALDMGASGTFGGILFPAGKYTVKLRLPLDHDTQLNLIAYPNALTETHPPQLDGELWVARMVVSFAPRNGQDIGGNILTIAENHKIVILENIKDIITHFAPTTRFTIQSAPENKNPNSDVKNKRIEIVSHNKSCYCGGTATLGEFVATNLVGITGADISWSANYGYMNPGNGLKSWAYVSGADEVTVTAYAIIDGTNYISNGVTIHRCAPPCGGGGVSCCSVCPNFSIEPKLRILSCKEPIGLLNVVSNNCAGFSGGVEWTVEPPEGLDVFGTTDSIFGFRPKNSTTGKYIVTASSTTHPGFSDSAEVYICDIEITGFSAEEIRLLHTNAVIASHLVTCHVNVMPPDVPLPLMFSFVGDDFGADITPLTGIIKPGYDRSGELTVRVEITGIGVCYDEAKITIRARPVKVIDSFVTYQITEYKRYYGSDWRHTFSGTGGSLAKIEISESVKRKKPYPFKYEEKNITPSHSNASILDANGTMHGVDMYNFSRNGIDASLFKTFPQTMRSWQ